MKETCSCISQLCDLSGPFAYCDSACYDPIIDCSSCGTYLAFLGLPFFQHKTLLRNTQAAMSLILITLSSSRPAGASPRCSTALATLFQTSVVFRMFSASSMTLWIGVPPLKQWLNATSRDALATSRLGSSRTTKTRGLLITEPGPRETSW